jgi:hypothetical protein
MLSNEQVAAPFALAGVPIVIGGPIIVGAPGPFPGYVDEVRVSRGVRYEESSSFAPAPRFDVDGDTLALYHFDEVSGEAAKDELGNSAHLAGARFEHPPSCRY